MKRVRLERFKSIFLALLIALSLTQLGILWYYQNHRFPISFLSSLYSMLNHDSPPDISRLKDEVILPTRILVSDEYTISRWLLGSEDRYFRELAIEAFSYIQTVLNDDFRQQPEKLPASRWSELSKPFVFEFSTPMNKEVIRFLSNIRKSEAPNAPDGIFRMAIAPWTDQNERNTLYFLYGDTIYKYTVPFIRNRFDRKAYENIFTLLIKDRGQVRYNLYRDIDPRKALGYPIIPEVAIVVKEPDEIQLPALAGYTPESITLKYNENGDPDPSSIAKTLLGSDLKNFDPPETDSEGTVTLKNANNIYKQYKNGLMEYTYWSQVPGENRGQLMNALEKAFAFIAEKQEMIDKSPNYRLALTGIGISGDGRYHVFSFNYIVNGYPVVLTQGAGDESGSRNGEEGQSESTGSEQDGTAEENGSGGTESEKNNAAGAKRVVDAVTIHVNAQGVASCRWYVRSFHVETGSDHVSGDRQANTDEDNEGRSIASVSLEDGGQDLYNISFDKFLEGYKIKYGELKGNTEANITDMRIAYMADANSADSGLKPIWIIEMAGKDGEKSYRFIEMPVGEEG